MDLIIVTSTINYVFYLLYEIKPNQVYSNVPVLLSDDFLYYYVKVFVLAKLYVRRIFQIFKYAYTCAST